ncbi:MAG: hypothetical protein LH606_10795 [Cytophagaceae bacterium]|nr:hypothetical protein [Cytophagaceae bacterium]
MNRYLLPVFCLFGTVALAQSPGDSSAVFTTNNKPVIEKSGRKTVIDEIKDKATKIRETIKDPEKLKDAALSRASVGASASAAGQEFNTDALPDLGLKIQPQKKKRKKADNTNNFFKSEYEGIGVTRVVNRFGAGDRATSEEFFVLKEYQQPSPYAKDIAWYDYRASRVTNVLIKDKAYAQILHGPYRRFVGDALMEEGYYYVGTKHARWTSYFPDFTLKDKVRFDKGFPEDSRVSYYDEAKTKVKEIVPKLYGKCSGDYRAFYEGGQLLLEGKMDDSVRVGKWREYHQFGTGGRTKKEIQYGRDKWDPAQPVVLREWDNRGKMIFENKDKKKPVEGEEESF